MPTHLEGNPELFSHGCLAKSQVRTQLLGDAARHGTIACAALRGLAACLPAHAPWWVRMARHGAPPNAPAGYPKHAGAFFHGVVGSSTESSSMPNPGRTGWVGWSFVSVVVAPAWSLGWVLGCSVIRRACRGF
ncbi:unnamed protein product [Lupinus luteus]|uniref:Uncharacterized protein n=1 Tax=Lupinus luteus TaxID=3873 RepID=A0AAV1YS66_LUPLU